MPFIKNPNYKPYDPTSKRYVEAASDAFFATPSQNISNSNNTPVISAPKADKPESANIPATQIEQQTNKSTPATVSIATVAPKQDNTAITKPSEVSFRDGLNDGQKKSITDLLSSGRAFSETDAKNYAFATGENDFSKFIGKTPDQIGFGSPDSTQNKTVQVQGEQITRENQQDNTFDTGSFAKNAGKTGASFEQFSSIVDEKSAIDRKQSDEIRNNLGIPDLIDDAYDKPTVKTQKLYSDLYDIKGLTEFKDKVKNLDEDITKVRNELIDTNKELYDDPWLSKATRNALLGRAADLAEQRVSNLLSEKQFYLDQYDIGVSEIEQEIVRAVTDDQSERTLTVDKLNFLLGEAERDEQFATRAIKQRNLRYYDDYFAGVNEASAADSELNELLSPTEARTLGVPYGTTKANAFGITPTSTDMIGELTNDQVSALNSIQSNRRQDPDIKGYIEVRDAYERVIASAEDPSPAGDLALIFNYMKILDPGSVVREGEFANAQNAGSIPERIRAQYNKVREGERLSAEQREDFVDRAGRLYEPKLNRYAEAEQFYAQQAQALGLPTELVGRDLSMVQDDQSEQQDLSTFYNNNPEKQAQIDQIIQQNPNITDEEVIRKVSFNNVGGDTYTAVDIPASSRLAYVNNNPGNLRFASQSGATQGEGGFARFSSPEAGYEALQAQIRLDASRGLTLAQFINKYAPPTENNTSLYLQQMVQATGATPNTPISSINLGTLARAMARKESSTVIA